MRDCRSPLLQRLNPGCRHELLVALRWPLVTHRVFMSTELILTGVLTALLVFLSTIESAYESLSEVSLRVLPSEHEDSPRRARFFRELMEHRRRLELILILGTQLSIAAI